jgi:hypothetical protein
VSGVTLLGSTATPADTWITGSSYWGVLDLTLDAPLKKNMVASDSSAGGHVTINNCVFNTLGTMVGTATTRRNFHLKGPDIFICNTYINGRYLDSPPTYTGVFDREVHLEKVDCAYMNNVHIQLGASLVAFENTSHLVFENGSVAGTDGHAIMGFSLSRTKLKGATCDNQYIANTSINDILDNDSEGITQDGAGGAYVGKLSASTSTTITLAHDPDWATLNKIVGEGVATIISGRGQGQSRKLAGGTGLNLTLETPWTITPDLDSVISISGRQKNLIFYHNTLTNVRTAIQLFGTVQDTTVADNLMQNCAGIVVRSRAQGAILPALNVDVINNVMEGNASNTNTSGQTKVKTNGIHFLSSSDGLLSGVLLRDNTYPPPGDLSFEQTVGRTMNVFAESNLGTTRAASLTAIAGHPTIVLKNNLLVEDTFTSGFGGNTSVYPRWRTGAGTDIAYSTTAVVDALQVTPAGTLTADRLFLRPFTGTTLATGDSIRLTVDFYSVSSGGQFRFGLYDINGTITDGSAYGSSSPQTLKNGYYTFFSVATTGVASPIRREHEAGASYGTPSSNSYTVLANTATGSSGDPAYVTQLTSGTANVDFRGQTNKVTAVLTITRGSGGNNTITAQLYQGGVLTGYNLSATESDGLGYDAFNTVAFLIPAATVFENVRVDCIPAP